MGGGGVLFGDLDLYNEFVWTPADVEAYANAINRYLSDKNKKSKKP
jgi:hypothetical protein